MSNYELAIEGLILIHCIDVDKNARRKKKIKYEFFLSSEVKMKKNNNHNKLLNKPN